MSVTYLDAPTRKELKEQLFMTTAVGITPHKMHQTELVSDNNMYNSNEVAKINL